METFGKYSLLRKIGSGGMAEVFLARTAVAQGLAKELVIKKIHPTYAQSPQFVAMFIDEARIALRLNHPNVIQVFDFGKEGDTYFLAMEFVDGIDLLKLMQACAAHKQTIPANIAAYIAEQISKGLDYAHRRVGDNNEPFGIVHRDISPQNILLSWDGGVKIVDFGIARARDMHEEPGTVKGKYAYMSPEQARGEMVDVRTDVFANGICLYEMLTGRPMYPGRGRQVLQQVKTATFRPPGEANPSIPTALQDILLRAVHQRPDGRYQAAREMGADLRRFALEHSRHTGELIESTTLAAYLARIIPKPDVAREAPLPRRRTSGMPPMDAGPLPPAGGTHDATGSLGMEGASLRRESRERKHVFVVEGGCRILRRLPNASAPSARADLLSNSSPPPRISFSSMRR
ncbi:MAG: serine/threonine protein kinase [Myxococcales bacterium]|nr:serine/threonine protein kinase [Myxococcales bacterium]